MDDRVPSAALGETTNLWHHHAEWVAAATVAVLLQMALIAGLLVHRARRRRSERSLLRSEERYREIIESQTQMVCRYLPNTTLTFVNEAYCRFFGKTREQMLGKKFLEFVPAHAQEEVRAQVDTLVSSRRRHSNEHEVLRSDGTTGWHLWEDYVILDERGEVEECQAIGHDITERKVAERAARLDNERMLLAAEAANLGFWVWDMTTKEVWMTEKRREMMGFAPTGTLMVTDCLQRIHPDDRASAEAILQRALDERGAFEAEYRILMPTEEVRWIASRGRCMLGENRTVAQVVGVSMDITHRKRADEAMQTLIHSARLVLVAELTASLAHELNQPLGAILSNTEAAEILLESGTPPLDEIRQILADIRRDDLRASMVIRHLRGLLRKQEPQLHPTDFHSLAGDALRLAASDARFRKVALETEFTAEPSEIQGDTIQLQQVLLNLILNGMEAMSETPETERRLRIGTRRNGKKEIHVEVTDAGQGIPDEALPRIFDSFFTTKESGMGLGLAIVRSIVEAHHGRITAQNNPGGRGATFSFTLPTLN